MNGYDDVDWASVAYGEALDAKRELSKKLQELFANVDERVADEYRKNAALEARIEDLEKTILELAKNLTWAMEKISKLQDQVLGLIPWGKEKP